MGRAATARTAPARRTAPGKRTVPGRRRTEPPGGSRRPGRRRTDDLQRRPTPARKPARRASGHSKLKNAARPRGARILDALLTGRGCIAIVGVLLGGIVFFNVDLLQMNRDITQMADRASQLKRENARLRIDLARLGSSERIQESALGLGLVYPAPGEVRYLKSDPPIDAKNASKRISAPDPSYVAPVPTPTTADPGVTAPDGSQTTDPTATDPTATDDPTAGPVDPATGLPVDPATGQTVYSPTGEPLDPATGLPLDTG